MQALFFLKQFYSHTLISLAELDHTKQSLSSHRSQIAQLTTAKEDWDGIRMTLTHQLDSNKLELEQVRKQNDWLREELETRASEVRKIRVDKVIYLEEERIEGGN